MTTSLLIQFLNGINLHLQTKVSVTEGDKIGAGLPQSAACICGRGQGKALMKSPPPFCCSPAAHHNTSWRWKCEDKKQKSPNFCRTVLSKHIEICLLAPAQSRVPSLCTCCLTHEEWTAHSPYSVYLSLPITRFHQKIIQEVVKKILYEFSTQNAWHIFICLATSCWFASHENVAFTSAL